MVCFAAFVGRAEQRDLAGVVRFQLLLASLWMVANFDVRGIRVNAISGYSSLYLFSIAYD